MTHQTHELFPDTPATARPRERRRRSVAAAPAPVRLTFTIEIPSGQNPPGWIAELLRLQPRTRRSRAGNQHVADFVQEHLVVEVKGRVTLAAMFGRYRAEALAAGEIPVTRNKFSEAAVKAVRSLHGVAPSNDLVEAGQTRRGFRGLALAPCPAPRGVHPSSTEKRLGAPAGQRGQGSPL
jgi:hypothetical protein